MSPLLAPAGARRLWAVLSLALSSNVPAAAEALREQPASGGCPVEPPMNAPSVEIAPGKRYEASGARRLLFGEDYRRLWTTPIRVPVLDLRRYDGGLAVVDEGGGKQTLSLKLESASGRGYRFRSVDKLPTKLLPGVLRPTIVGSLLQDQTAAELPAASLVVGPLLDRVGVLNAKTPLFVMADDDGLGRFRETFAGMLGTLEQVPGRGDATPEFAAVDEVLSTAKLYERQLKHPRERIDARAFLRARLVDVLVGDWDRHELQWRWGRSRESGAWLPIPHDRDQAFTKLQGATLAVARLWAPRFVVYGPRYPQVKGLAWNSRDVDRRLLSPLSWADWQEAIRSVQRQLDDAALAAAVCHLPPEHYRLVGRQLEAALVARRDGLPAFAHSLYRLLSDQVDVFVTEGDDVARVERRADGAVRVRISDPDAAAPWFDRLFVPGETREIRLYLEGGDDRLTSTGSGPRRIKVRVIGGEGDDLLDDSAGGGVRFYDSSGHDEVRRGPGTRFDDRAWVPPIDDPESRPLDWSGDSTLLPWADYYQDAGLLVGAALRLRTYGFRQYPYAHSQTFRLSYATRAGAWRAEYLADFRRRGALEPRGELVALASGYEVLRFYGFGNETTSTAPYNYYRVEQQQYLIAPSLVRSLAGGNVSFGPLARYARTPPEQDQYIASVQPYGIGAFGELGVHAGLSFDRRDRKDAARKGLLFTSDGTFYPALWSVRSAFGQARGAFAAYAPLPFDASLALRVGGQRVFGRYPFQDAAFLGSWDTVRGLPQNRYAGDASLYANVELRLPLGLDLFSSGRIGLFALTDTGRVYLDGETSSRWHRSWGGGTWLAFANGRRTMSAALAHSEGNLGFYVHGGLLF